MGTTRTSQTKGSHTADTGFYANAHPLRVTSKPHHDGGMLFIATPSFVQLFASYPQKLPWAADKTAVRPTWRRNRGQIALGFRTIVDKAERLRALRADEQARGRVAAHHPELESFAAFLAHCDPAIVRAVVPYERGAFPIYNAVRRCPGMLDLLGADDDPEGLAGNGALAYALSEVGFFVPERRARQLEYARRLLRKKRREMVTALGFPDRHARLAVTLLGKMPRSAVNLFTLRALRSLLDGDDRRVIKLLSHCERINAPVLELVSDGMLLPAVTANLLHDVGRMPHVGRTPNPTAGLLRDALDLVALRGGPLPSVKSLEGLNALHETEVLRQGRSQRTFTDNDLRPAPLEELPGVIEYVSHSSSALHAEGAKMHNCVAGYGRRVAAGECFVYRVLSPERCTLSITRDADGEFEISELKRACNVAPTAATRRSVESWLRRAPRLSIDLSPLDDQPDLAPAPAQRPHYINPLYAEPLFATPYYGNPDFEPSYLASIGEAAE